MNLYRHDHTEKISKVLFIIKINFFLHNLLINNFLYQSSYNRNQIVKINNLFAPSCNVYIYTTTVAYIIMIRYTFIYRWLKYKRSVPAEHSLRIK